MPSGTERLINDERKVTRMTGTANQPTGQFRGIRGREDGQRGEGGDGRNVFEWKVPQNTVGVVEENRWSVVEDGTGPDHSRRRQYTETKQMIRFFKNISKLRQSVNG
jgi:hypothetical protein